MPHPPPLGLLVASLVMVAGSTTRLTSPGMWRSRWRPGAGVGGRGGAGVEGLPPAWRKVRVRRLNGAMASYYIAPNGPR